MKTFELAVALLFLSGTAFSECPGDRLQPGQSNKPCGPGPSAPLPPCVLPGCGDLLEPAQGIILPVHAGAAPHAHPHGPNAVQQKGAPAPGTRSQEIVWQAEESLVAVTIESENQLLAFAKAVEAEKRFFASVPPQVMAGFGKLIQDGAAAQKKLVDLKVLKTDGRGGLAFGLRGAAPSADAVKAVDDYVETMAKFDESPDSLYVLTVLSRGFQKDPNALPPNLKAAVQRYFVSSQELLRLKLMATAVLAKAVAANGGRVNSRWGFEEPEPSAAPGTAPKGAPKTRI